jgi:hypothetical protein
VGWGAIEASNEKEEKYIFFKKDCLLVGSGEIIGRKEGGASVYPSMK